MGWVRHEIIIQRLLQRIFTTGWGQIQRRRSLRPRLMSPNLNVCYPTDLTSQDNPTQKSTKRRVSQDEAFAF
jgi:hypothetical protein